ncbi:hypothetical protein T01_1365 [Trichinella spiralis]|uniref:Uncharacterized protein n=1 Tax=Trichinella spiralis TaxID=6334 RepID=A0A0V1C0S3_TRISP|nr:hypothetical protein T01_1365 [Trichinella spiralis]
MSLLRGKILSDQQRNLDMVILTKSEANYSDLAKGQYRMLPSNITCIQFCKENMENIISLKIRKDGKEKSTERKEITAETLNCIVQLCRCDNCFISVQIKVSDCHKLGAKSENSCNNSIVNFNDSIYSAYQKWLYHLQHVWCLSSSWRFEDQFEKWINCFDAERINFLCEGNV